MMEFIRKVGRSLGLLGKAADAVGDAVEIWDPEPKEQSHAPPPPRPIDRPDEPYSGGA